MLHLAFNWLLRRNRDRSHVSRLVRLVQNYPNWLKGVDREVVVNTHHGFPLRCDRGDYIGQIIIETGEWEPLVSRTISAAIDQGDVAIDIGANIGYDTLLMSRATGDRGLVLSFEPDPSNLRMLYDNLRLNAVRNVAVQNMALSDVTGWVELAADFSGNVGQAHLRPTAVSRNTRRIMAVRLDSLIQLVDGENIALVKLDIEGFEYKALRGMGDLLSRVRYVITEVDNEFLRECGSSAKQLFELMAQNGFSACCADPESSELWRKSGSDYRPKKTFTSGHAPFDVLFWRELGPKVRALIE